MRTFNGALLGHAFSSLAGYAEAAGGKHRASGTHIKAVGKEEFEDISLSLAAAKVIALHLDLLETKDAISRLSRELKSTVEPMTYVKLHFGLGGLIELMKNELDKRKVFVIDPAKSHYYQADIFGVAPPTRETFNALLDKPVPEPLFGKEAVAAFPSTYMDIVEAGRCLALNRNNAAIYHLMQVAEVGLRTLAWDRRVELRQHKGKTIVPLENAQWGQMIGAVQTKRDLIHHWPRSKTLKDEAVRYYTRAIFEVDSFNEIFRKHISHARGELYETDVALSCWGHVYRFMNMLTERMSENKRTPNVWPSTKKASSKKK